ncbi:SHOCT domain-containing protein [Kitasatospora sp. NPDC006697]|uniref:SHOCT domain-containing protein n=1 Tax=Kitasatospora sp. NPDC006697 TaxID=3364020 RepID=UPI0036969925
MVTVGFGLLAVLLVVLIVLVLRAQAARRAEPAAGPPVWGGAGATAVGRGGSAEAERILAERYAKGELDDEEYQRRLRTLREPPG